MAGKELVNDVILQLRPIAPYPVDAALSLILHVSFLRIPGVGDSAVSTRCSGVTISELTAAHWNATVPPVGYRSTFEIYVTLGEPCQAAHPAS
jgi:hypothetical protein